MKTPIILSIVTSLTALPLIAQDDTSGDNQNNRLKGPPPSRLMLTLDADHDRIISAAEIANATTALESLDKDGDGQLIKEEFCRPKPRDKKDDKARDEEDDKPSGHRPPPPDPLAGAIDADHDHVISTAELAAASTSLATLDKNNDGQLTREEFAPKPRRKPHGPKDPANSSNSEEQEPEQDGPPPQD